MQKTVYVVRTTDDGNIGVYDTKAKAVARLKQVGEALEKGKVTTSWFDKDCLFVCTMYVNRYDEIGQVQRFWLD
jgi:hypothetical protein